MQEQNEMEETLRDVCAQRDRAFRALEHLVDRFWAAHYNHAFAVEDKPDKKDENGKTIVHRCSAGKSYMDIFHGCDSFLKKGVCKEFDCPMGFHHFHFYKAAEEAQRVLNEDFAEKKPFNLERIPRYGHAKRYSVSPQWFARMEYMFLLSLKLGEECDEARSRALGDALSSLVSIGLSTLGYQIPFDTFTDVPKNEDDPRIVALKELLAPFNDKYGERLQQMENVKIEEYDRMLDSDGEFALAYLVFNIMVFLGEYAFGHDYPGADLGVYGDVVQRMKHDCLVVMRIKRSQFDIIKNVNDAALDADGFKVEDL